MIDYSRDPAGCHISTPMCYLSKAMSIDNEGNLETASFLSVSLTASYFKHLRASKIFWMMRIMATSSVYKSEMKSLYCSFLLNGLFGWNVGQ